jgi:hypothetical protein
MKAVDWEAIEADVGDDGLVDSLAMADDGEGGMIGVETRYARLESIATTDEFVAIEADDGGDGFVQVRVPWVTLEELVARRNTVAAEYEPGGRQWAERNAGLADFCDS